MAARRELLERIENESKAYVSDFGSHYLTTWQEFETAVRSLCYQYVLLSFSLCHYRASTIDQFGFKNVISLRPPYLGGFQEHDKRWVFQTMSCFSSGTGVRLGHCIIFCHALGIPPVWRPPRSWNWIGLYASWAYLRSSYVNTALPLRLWCSWLCPRCCSDASNCFTMHSCYDSISALPFPPRYIVLVRAQTRCACFKPT